MIPKEPSPSRDPWPCEVVWAFETNVKWVVCELRDNGSDGIEVLLAHDGGASVSQLFDARAEAMAHADAIRKPLEAAGWRPVVTA